MYDALTTQFPALEVDKYVMHYLYTDQTNHSYKYWHAKITPTTATVSV